MLVVVFLKKFFCNCWFCMKKCICIFFSVSIFVPNIFCGYTLFLPCIIFCSWINIIIMKFIYQDAKQLFSPLMCHIFKDMYKKYHFIIYVSVIWQKRISNALVHVSKYNCLGVHEKGIKIWKKNWIFDVMEEKLNIWCCDFFQTRKFWVTNKWSIFFQGQRKIP